MFKGSAPGQIVFFYRTLLKERKKICYYTWAPGQRFRMEDGSTNGIGSGGGLKRNK